MKKGASRQVKIGIFGLAMAILLYLGINFLKSKRIFSNDNIFYVEYNQADGLEVSSPVLIKGFKVGTIDKISFDIHKSTVIVRMAVNGDYPIPDDSKAKVASSSLLGGKTIEIVLGKSDTVLADDSYITPLVEQGILEIAGTEYEKLKEQASSLIQHVSDALVAINQVLSAQNVANISATLANLNKMSADLNTLVSSQQTNIDGMLSNLNNISSTLNQQMPKLTNTLDNFNTLSVSLAQKSPDLLDNASQAMANLNKILSQVQTKEGTIGKLVNDDMVYTNLANATGALTLLLEDIKTNPKRYINISVFGGGNKDKKSSK